MPERWLSTLKPLVPADQAAFAVELEARLLVARNQKPKIATLIQDYVGQYPNQIGVGALLLDRFGLNREAEQAFRARPGPKSRRTGTFTGSDRIPGPP